VGSSDDSKASRKKKLWRVPDFFKPLKGVKIFPQNFFALKVGLGRESSRGYAHKNSMVNKSII